MNQVIETIKNRRSIRSYLPEQIKKEELDLIIEAAVYAPSGGNEQPWHFTVVRNNDLIRHISTKSKEIMAKSDVDWIRNMGLNKRLDLFYGAPTLIIVSGRTDSITWEEDCSAAIQNMLIAAESLGIGSTWIGLINHFFSQNDEMKPLKIPEGYKPFHGVALGYKAVKKLQAPKRDFNVVDYIQ